VRVDRGPVLETLEVEHPDGLSCHTVLGPEALHEPEDGASGIGKDGVHEVGIERHGQPKLEGKAHDPLAIRDVRQETVDAPRGEFGHPPAAAAWAHGRLTGERDDPRSETAVACEANEASREIAAVGDGPEGVEDEIRGRVLVAVLPAPLLERVEVPPQDLDEHRRARVARPVERPAGWGPMGASRLAV
jgi:hypothetical protein